MIDGDDRPAERDLLDDGLSLRFLRASDGGEGDENGDENEQTKQVAHVLFLLAFTRTDAGGLRGFEVARRGVPVAPAAYLKGARTGP